METLLLESGGLIPGLGRFLKPTDPPGGPFCPPEIGLTLTARPPRPLAAEGRLILVRMQSPRATLNVVSLIAAAVLLRTCSARCAKHGA